ncbi:transposase [Nocardia carnea]|uniref:transposase n=1 Tax=Nocardia carnea TaxID=37328 RepID=UPI0002EAC6B4|nr:transposase [Nocardia carnea]
MNSVHDTGAAGTVGDLSAFRRELYRCLSRRADAVFELVDAVLCADGPVRSLPELSLIGEHRRGHGSIYAGLDRGRIDIARLRRALVSVPLRCRRRNCAASYPAPNPRVAVRRRP